MIKKSSKRWLLLTSLVLLFSVLAAPFAAQLETAQAYTYPAPAGTTAEQCLAAGGKLQLTTGGAPGCLMPSTPAQDARLLLTAGWLAGCLANQDKISATDLANNQLSSGEKNGIIGHILNPDEGMINCNVTKNVTDALRNVGYPDLLTLTKAAGCVPAGAGSTQCSGLRTGDTFGNKIYQKIVNSKWGAGSAALTAPDMYYIVHNTFVAGCQANRIASPTAAERSAAELATKDDTASHYFAITEVSAAGDVVSPKAVYKAVHQRNRSISTANQSLMWDDGAFDCSALADMTATYARAYATWIANNQKLAATMATQENSAAGGSEGASTCTIDGVGWIVCPVVNFLAYIADASFGFLANNFLSTNPKIFDSANPTFSAWSVMRNLANVAFVIAFLIIIFSQLTSVGITNYGVKKMLPRLIIAAILVNISYFICQIAVDLSNILGFSVKSLLEGLGAQATSANTSGAASSWATGGGGFVKVSGTILAIGGAALILYALLATLVPVLLAAVVALIMILFILVARQALIILLIVISPLAFVAYLLPNTEQWFKKWQKAFTAMLLLFPIVALVFGMSSLASQILTGVNATGGKGLIDGGFSGEANTVFGQIVAAAIMVLPLFIIPGLLKKALDGVGGIGAKINGLGGKLGGALGKKGSQGYENSRVGQYKKFRAANFARNRALVQSGKYTGGGIRGAASSLNNKFNKSNLSGKFGDRSAAAGASQVIKEENEEVENAERLIRTEKGPDELLGHAQTTFQDAVKSGDTIKARAAQKILLNSGAKGLGLLHESLTSVVQTETNASTIADIKTDINGAGLKGRDNVVNTYGHDSRSMGEIENDKKIIGGLTPAELAGQIDGNLEHAERIGAISPAQAQLIIDNPNSAQLLNGPKLAVLHGIIAGRTPPPPAGPPPTPPPATP